MLRAITKYDDKHEAIMTTLFYYPYEGSKEVVVAVPGWKHLDDLIKYATKQGYLKRR